MAIRRILPIVTYWDGAPAPEHEHACIALEQTQDTWSANIFSPLGDGPQPSSPRGLTDRLWEYEVVELFIGNDDGAYLELEFGPEGHHLGLLFSGYRAQTGDPCTVITFDTEKKDACWKGVATWDAALVPSDPTRINAFAIRSCGDERRFFAHRGRRGDAPEFHDLSTFARL